MGLSFLFLLSKCQLFSGLVGGAYAQPVSDSKCQPQWHL